MIKLYTAPTPNGKKVSIALEELELPYEVQSVDLSANEQLEDWFLALNPNHKVPVIEDDGLVIWESGAILLHLAEKYGKLLPADPARRIEAIQYAFFQTGGIGPNMGAIGAAVRMPEERRSKSMIEHFSTEVNRLFDVLERILSDGRPYLAHEYSIGDIMHYGWMGLAYRLNSPDLFERKRVVEWTERIAARPAVQKGENVP